VKRKHLILPVAGATALGLAIATLSALRDDGGSDSWGTLRAGDSLHYTLNMDSSTEASGAAVISGLHLAGKWTVLVLQRQGDRLDLSGTLAVNTLELGDQVGGAELARVREALARPLFFSLAGDGSLAELRFDRDWPALAETIARSLVSYTQVVRPAEARDAWEVAERDHTGRYQARYTRVSRDRLRKQKLRYTASRPGTAELTVKASQHDIQIQQGGWLQQLVVDETIDASLGQQMDMSNRTRLVLRQAGRAHDVAQALAALAIAANRPVLAVDAPPASRDVFRQWDRARAEGHSVQTLLPQLLTRRAAGDSSEANELFGRLAAVLRVDEEAVGQVDSRLREDRSNWKLLADVLAAAGTPQAQASLVRLLEQAAPAHVAKGAVLVSLSLVREPTPRSVDTLKSLVDDPELGGQAKLGLGSYAAALSEIEPARARSVLTLLVGGLGRADGQARLDYLDALGNAGLPEAVSAVEKYLGSDENSVREHAVRALRRVPGEAAERHIVRMLGQDRSATVRTSAALAARDRGPAPVLTAALDIAARKEPDLVTRFTALKTIIIHLDEAPSLRASLEWAAQHDPNPELREALKGYRP
jgi:hypothetical protein